jgi:hypothetical protein
MLRIFKILITITLFTLMAHSALAQQVAVLNTDAAKPAPKPQGDAQTECKICRWVDLQMANIATRYRFVENSASVTTNNQLQDNVAVKARFKFDRKGKYSINGGVFTGNTFTGGWNNTGLGTGKLFTNLYVKQLYFSARPVAGVEFQYGGLYVERGENTEATTYDNDAYITGERVTVKRPKQFFFDQISVTYAYLGDTNTPSVFRRFSRLNESNYHQVLASKAIGKRAVVSADYTFQSGIETTRAAVRVNAKELHVLDSIRFETYRRMDVNTDGGFAISGEKSWFKKRLVVGGGYAQIDKAFGGLNGDRYNRGKRLFAYGNYQISPEFGVNTFWTSAVDNPYAVSNRRRLDLIFSYNLLKTLQRTHLF